MGTLLSLLSEAMPPSPKWSVDDIPDLGGMVVIVTGGNSGIGKETVHHLLTHNAKVYMACRSPSKASAAAADLKKSTGKGDAELVVLQMDLGDLASVKGAVEEFLSKESRLDILYNNAGIMYPPHSLLTSHGHDAQFGTNVLGPYYLTTLLLPLLIATASSSILVSSPTSSPSFPSASRDGSSSAKGSGKGSGKGNATGKVRIVNLASSTHLLAPSPSKGGPVIMDSLVPGRRRDGMSTVELYCQSKAGNVLFSNALARKFGSQGIVSTSLNPGNIRTDLTRHMSAFQRRVITPFLQPIPKGALTQLWAGTAPETGEVNGKYFGPWARVRPARSDTDSIEKQEEVWAWCEEQVRLFAPK